MAATRKQQEEFVAKLFPIAVKLYWESEGFHPFFVVAQAAMETGWKIAGNNNNLFGITIGSSWKGPKSLSLTTEYFSTSNKRFTYPEEKVVSVEPVTRNGKVVYRYRVYRYFRVYASLEECLEDYLKVLKGKNFTDAYPYKHDMNEYVERIVDDVGPKYATDPDYARQMKKLMRQVNDIVDRLGLNKAL